MKTFNNLKFKLISLGLQALIFFKNGYGASVLCGERFYSNGRNTYELAVLKGTRKCHEICFNSGLTEDVFGNLSKNEISEVLKQIQNL